MEPGGRPRVIAEHARAQRERETRTRTRKAQKENTCYSDSQNPVPAAADRHSLDEEDSAVPADPVRPGPGEPVPGPGPGQPVPGDWRRHDPASCQSSSAELRPTHNCCLHGPPQHRTRDGRHGGSADRPDRCGSGSVWCGRGLADPDDDQWKK